MDSDNVNVDYDNYISFHTVYFRQLIYVGALWNSVTVPTVRNALGAYEKQNEVYITGFYSAQTNWELDMGRLLYPLFLSGRTYSFMPWH